MFGTIKTPIRTTNNRPNTGGAMSAKHMIAIALGLSLAGPSRAADITKYMPDKASLYIHINVKQLLTAPVVRKALPMAVDKYGDQLLPLIQLAKQFNPAA